MDDIKLRLNASVAAQLSAAPPSADKDELIEELSDNLYRRFLDMTGAGMAEEAAFNRALEDLGDVDELLAYLGVKPETDLRITVTPDGSQTEIETRDGQRVVINTGDDVPITIKGGGESPAADETQPQDGQDAPVDGQPEGRTDERGDAHYDYNPESPQSDLDAIFANVSEVCRIAMEQAKEAVKQAKDAIQRRTTVEKDKGHVKVNFNTHPNGPGDKTAPPVPPVPPVPPTPPTPPVPPTPPTPPSGKGWEFEAELDSDEGRFFAGAGPKERKDIVYGFGYDKAKGGFFAQWGEWKGEAQEGGGPRFTGAPGSDSYMAHQDDGSYSVTALKDLRGIEVFTTAGDVVIHVSEAPDAGVIIDGDVDDLDVTCSADGVLTIREGRTASSSFFSRRGFCSADVELFLPCRHWEMISVTTANGDVEIDKDGLDIDQLRVTTSSGDLDCRLRACGQFQFTSASGDLELSGTCTALRVQTASGDAVLHGQFGDVSLKTASGDIELEGLVSSFRGGTMSGDVRVETSELPQVMEMSSKSGDCEARIPDAGPFTLRMKTISGEMDCDFHMNYINGMLVYGDGSGPAYSMTTVSGDVTIERY